MDYKKAYLALIEQAQSRPMPASYTERHHITPKCLGGSNEKTNIAILTAREHFLAHRLLCKIYPKNYKLSFALMIMSSGKSKSAVGHKVSSREYQKIRADFQRNLKIYHPQRGKKLTEEQRAKISQYNPRLSGEKHPMYGRKHSEKTRMLLRENSPRASGKDHAMYGKKHSQKTKDMMSAAHKSRIETMWNHSSNTYIFSKDEGNIIFTGKRYEFCTKFNISTSSSGLSRMLNGKQKTFAGWSAVKAGA